MLAKRCLVPRSTAHRGQKRRVPPLWRTLPGRDPAVHGAQEPCPHSAVSARPTRTRNPVAEAKRTHLTWLRVGTQVLALGTFVYLALAARLGWGSPLPHDLFLRLDPLVWVASSLGPRALAPYAALALGLLAVTAVFGRVFCGWLCPLGSLMDGAGLVRRRWRGVSLSKRLGIVRFAVLIALIGASVAGANLVGWLDPLVMSARALHLTRGARLDWTGTVIACMLVGTVVATALLAPRMWCRVACPLGAMLSLVARFAAWRRRLLGGCTECGACSSVCPMGNSWAEHSPSDCIGCRRCEAACSQHAVRFGFAVHPGRARTDAVGERPSTVSRRGFVAGLIAFAAGGGSGLIVRWKSGSIPLRAPGVSDEAEFLAKCVGCGTCMAVCPTGGLLPFMSGTRLDAVFTPKLVPSVGACLPNCTACGRACPTGAIARIRVEDKPKVRIGLAVIDRSRCLPWAKRERCFVCENHCPRVYGAIEMRPTGDGVMLPHVRGRQCTGCGLCEHECPEEAIRVVAVSGIGAR